ncbi:hypothetical protein D9756_004598 [Leucocoprinus leucothites]|uniref:F-box domain-containing protein n=1 Tax=Leucocoprinus leucothites TaxID=201217 RepID=A0A8H5G9D5_9AGAR|nr:hypothetical protein D9756_004598 [Leucoagaricus leucothites]
MSDDHTNSLGPLLSKLPRELVLEVTLTLCSFSQNSYANILLVCRPLYNLCRLNCLSAVPVVLQTHHQATLFAEYLQATPSAAPRIRRLWIIKDLHNIIPQCTNLYSLACDGHDLVPISSSETFHHTHLNDLTIMGLWDFWSPFLKARHSRTLCGKLQKLWLLDHLFLRGVAMEWWSSLRELYYWSIEGRGGRDQFQDEVDLLKSLPALEKFGVIMHSPSPSVFRQLAQIGDARLGVVAWGIEGK